VKREDPSDQPRKSFSRERRKSSRRGGPPGSTYVKGERINEILKMEGTRTRRPLGRIKSKKRRSLLTGERKKKKW